MWLSITFINTLITVFASYMAEGMFFYDVCLSWQAHRNRKNGRYGRYLLEYATAQILQREQWWKNISIAWSSTGQSQNCKYQLKIARYPKVWLLFGFGLIRAHQKGWQWSAASLAMMASTHVLDSNMLFCINFDSHTDLDLDRIWTN